jgi:hypothetical protein
MKYFLLSLSLSLVTASQLFADETKKELPIAPVDLGSKKYLSPVTDLHVLTEAFERGFPLATEVGTGTALPDLKEDQSYDAVMENGKIQREAVLQRYRDSLQKSKELRETRQKGPSPEKPGQAPQVVTAPAVSVGPFTPSKFCSCARESLRALKLKHRVLSLNNAIEAYQFEAFLRPERGNGKTISAEGIACGSHLGEYGAPVTNSLLEIQTLAALTKPAITADTERLWHYFLLFTAAARGEKLGAAYFWQYAWKKVAFQWLMTKDPVSSIDAVIATYVKSSESSIKKEKGQLTVSVSKEGISKAILEDWNSRTLPKDLKPCEVAP